MIDTSSTPAAVLAFAAWNALHVLLILGYRTVLINTGKAKPNGFGPSRNEPQDSFMGRVSNSHANCVENLPLFLAVVLANFLVEGAPDISSLAWKYVACRVAQGVAHWTSLSELVITVRFICLVSGFWFLGKMAYVTVVTD